VIDVIDLKKTFGDLEVLKGINVTINKGDIVVVIGPSGSGKSTFLRCLNCMEDPTSGSIIFNGVDIADMRVDINIHRRHMGMVFQHFNLFNNMTVIENIMMAPVYVRCKELKKAKRKGTLAPDAPKTKAEIKAQAREEALELFIAGIAPPYGEPQQSHEQGHKYRATDKFTHGAPTRDTGDEAACERNIRNIP
jgi:polar amino acid transport system ATP-binding protein